MRREKPGNRGHSNKTALKQAYYTKQSSGHVPTVQRDELISWPGRDIPMILTPTHLYNSVYCTYDKNILTHTQSYYKKYKSSMSKSEPRK